MRQDSTGTKQLAKLIGGIALGAIAMYLADPAQGRRRRAMAQDKIRGMTHKTGDAINVAVRDAGNRLAGLQAQANRLLAQGSRSKPIDNHVLEARVRSRLGRMLMNSPPIDITAQQGSVVLRGSVDAEEKAQLMKAAQAIPGVLEVKDRLQVHDQAGGMSRSQSRGWLAPQSWSFGTWLLAALGGGVLGYYAMTRRTSSGELAAVAGLGFLARTLGSTDMKRLFGSGDGTQPVDLQKTIEINASPETVFDIWSKYENFPHFMSHVVEVRDLGDQRSHWVVKGPAGANIEWVSVLTESTRPSVLAWECEPGAEVENAGSVRLEPSSTGGTRATVQMSYSPPAGIVGKSLARLLGSDPQRELEDNLLRMKNFIENGNSPKDVAQPPSASGKILH